MKKIEIKLSRTKTLRLVTGSFVFVIFGLLFLLAPVTFIYPILRNVMIIRIVGVIGVLFFGTVGLLGLKKMFNKTLGLTIDENGITDNTNATSVGLINWADITEIKTKQVMSSKSLLIFTSNPDKYLNRANGFKRILMKGNMKMCGTPLTITPNTLNVGFDKLERLIKENYNQQKNKMQNR